MKKITILFLFFTLLSACVSKKKLVKKIKMNDEIGKFDVALADKTLKKLGKKRDKNTDKLVSTVTQHYVDKILEEGDNIIHNDQSSKGYERAIAKYISAQNIINEVNASYSVPVATWGVYYEERLVNLKDGLYEKSYKEGVALFEEKQYEEAIEKFLLVQKNKPSYEDNNKYIENTNQKIAEKDYANGISLFSAKKYEDANIAFKKVVQRIATFEDAQNYEKVTYEKVTEERYDKGVTAFNSKNYTQALSIFDDIIKRDANYKNAQEYRKKSYDSITEEIYQSALNFYENKDYQSALTTFNKVENRDRNYKDATSYKNKSYDGITTEQYQEAKNDFNAKRYKTALVALRAVKDRARATDILPRLNNEIAVAEEKSILKIAIEGESAYDLLKEMEKEYKNNNDVRFTTSSSSDIVIRVNSRREIKTNNISKTQNTGYLVETSVQKNITFYKASTPVEYHTYRGYKEIELVSEYFISNTIYKGESKESNIDRINAVICPTQINGALSTNKINDFSPSPIYADIFLNASNTRITFLSDDELVQRGNLINTNIKKLSKMVKTDIDKILKQVK